MHFTKATVKYTQTQAKKKKNLCWVIKTNWIKLLNLFLSEVFKPIFASAKICINPTAEVQLKSPKANLQLEVQNIAIEMTKPQVTWDKHGGWRTGGGRWHQLFPLGVLCSIWAFWTCWSPLTWWRRTPPTGSSDLRFPYKKMPNSGKFDWSEMSFCCQLRNWNYSQPGVLI